MNFKVMFIILITVFLFACGGSGGESESISSNVVNSTDSNITISGDLSPALGQSVALIATIADVNTDEASILWTQNTGESLELVATNSAVLAFDISQSGNYGFTVVITTKDGVKYSENIDFSTTVTTDILNVRRDFSSREGNKISFKLSAPIDAQTGNIINGSYTNIEWLQTSGPSVIFDNENTNPLTTIFNAPEVDKDTVVTFDVSARHPDGNTVTDKVHLLIQNIETIPSSSIYDEVVAKVTPYNINSSMANGLENCIYSNYFSSPCSLSEINLIGQVHVSPTIDQIMDRVVSSHPWMAENFKRFLTEQDPHGDFKKLLRSVSAIVISYDIRPSYYWVATGAIYLDPEDLWLTPEQRDVIDVAPDYRSAFGQELQYLMPWRYVKNSDYASTSYSDELRVTRTIEDLIPGLGSLLYHELAHANDNFPSSILSSVNGDSIYDAYLQREGQKIADKLTAAHPKSSIEMTELGQVNFRGQEATATQKSYTPDDVAFFFSHDNAPTEYAYSSIAEDVATLFDATMMSARYGIERDDAVISIISEENPSASYILSWGQRGRIKDPAVEPRAKFVFERVFPELDSDAFFSVLPEVRQLQTGVDWWEALIITSTFNNSVPDYSPINYSTINNVNTSNSKAQKTKNITIDRPIELDLIRRYQ